MKTNIGGRILPAFVLLLGACGSSGGTTDNGASPDPPASDVVESVDSSTDTEQSQDDASALAVCEASPVGRVASDGGDILYENGTVVAIGRHANSSGCVNGLELTYELDGGCRLDLSFETQQGVWILEKALLAADAACGDFWSGEPVTFELDAANSVGALIGATDVQDGACSDSPDLKLVGRAALVFQAADATDNKYINLQLNGLALKGGITSTGVDIDACPTEPRLCQGIACGEDYFGAECGGCDEGFTCAAGACEVGGCIAGGDGKSLGFHIADSEWTTSTNDTFRLHDVCGPGAVWIIKTASW